MIGLVPYLKRHSKKLVAIVVIISLFWLTRLPALSAQQRNSLASRFQFTSFSLPTLAGKTPQFIRPVHPSLERHSSWISSVGAAIALNDIDGDGLSNDVCYVDTRTDQVIVAPVPETGNRYQPFGLEANNSSYEADTTAPMGCLPGDLNEDGLTDILVYYWGRTPVAFLHQEQQTNHTIAPESYVQRELVPSQERWYTNAATFADLDGDGHSDLIIGNYFQDGAQILNANATNSMESMQHSMSRADNGGKNHLLLWQSATAGKQPQVQFQEVKGILAPTVAQGWTLAVGTADLDGDLRPEIYFANDFGPDRLLHNDSEPGKLAFNLLEGKKGFTTPNSKVLGHDSFKGMGVDFGDVNHDGLLDIYVSNIAAEYALEESHFLFASTGNTAQMQQGIAPYVDRSESLGLSRSDWGWETKFGDFDNDGELEALQATGFVKGKINRWPELHELAMGNDEILSHPDIWLRVQPGDDLSGYPHNPFFVRATDGRYYDLAPELGLDQPQVTRGIATADVDGDGDLDFAIANQWENSFFYRNDSPHPGQFLALKLWQTQERKHAPRLPAIGAAATVYLPNGQKLVAQVDGGNGHSGARSPELHFGLGQVPSHSQLSVEVQWRDLEGKVHQEKLQLSPGRHTVVLGKSAELLSNWS